MELLLTAIAGAITGAIGMSLLAASAVSQLKRDYENQLRALNDRHARELKAEYQRGKESDGVYRADDGTGQMRSVKKEYARRQGDKVTAAK